MEYHVHLDRPVADPCGLEEAIRELDPAATVAIDAHEGRLRVSSWVSSGDLLELLQHEGWTVAPGRFVELPSVCCGSCSG